MFLRELFEAPGKTAVLAFGRLNPPTIGHAKLVEKIKSIPGDHYLFLSHSQHPKKDPLDFNTKVKFANAFFPDISIGSSNVKTPVDALQLLQSKGYTDIVFVAGSDRVEGFQTLFDKYNGQPDKSGRVPFNFTSINVVSAGERDPDADDVSGMSASKMRSLAAEGNFESFAQGVPNPKLAKQMYDSIRNAMGISESVDENFADGKKKAYNESNPFTDARMNAIKAGKTSFKVGGKTYKVTGDTSDELAANENFADGKKSGRKEVEES